MAARRQAGSARRQPADHAVTTAVAQFGWVTLVLGHHHRSVLVWAVVLTLIEMVGPIIAESGGASAAVPAGSSRRRRLVERVARPHVHHERGSTDRLMPTPLPAVRQLLGRAR